MIVLVSVWPLVSLVISVQFLPIKMFFVACDDVTCVVSNYFGVFYYVVTCNCCLLLLQKYCSIPKAVRSESCHGRGILIIIIVNRIMRCHSLVSNSA